MKFKLSQIWEGWKNEHFPDEEMRSQIEEVKHERRKTCSQMPTLRKG